MRERYELALKISCAVLAGLLLVQVGSVLFRKNPFKDLKIPALPALATASDAATPGKGTNSVSAPANTKGTTNALRADSASKGTNSAPGMAGGKTDSNSVSRPMAATGGTNSVADHRTEKTEPDNRKERKESKEPEVAADAPGRTETNGVALGKSGSNSVAIGESGKGGSNVIARLESGKGGTNSVIGTNSSVKGKGPGSRPDMAMMAGGGPGRPGANKGPDLAPAIQARVDKIVESEILGPVFHPLPMGLLGIAGNVAFIRSPSGQTGLVKEGDELGGVKLLQIGTNRVLVEQSGEKKELMIFSGYGSETLMPKEKDKTNETTSKHP
jgi:hypothetical protein